MGWTGSAINHDDDIGPPWGSPGLANGVTMQEGWITGGYNALNQLFTVWSPTTPGGAFVSLAYDPLGRCVKRAPGNGGAPLFLYYDGWNLIQEGPTSAIADRTYVHGNRVDEIVASQAGGQWYYHHCDARGHVTPDSLPSSLFPSSLLRCISQSRNTTERILCPLSLLWRVTYLLYCRAIRYSFVL